MDERYETFESVEERLQAIVDEVSRDDISLDDALQLYEEAAKLTGVACSLSEQGIAEMYPPEEPVDGAPAEGEAHADGADGTRDAEAGSRQADADESAPAEAGASGEPGTVAEAAPAL